MSCDYVREAVDGKRSLAQHEEVPYLRHLRSCHDCRLEIPVEKRRQAIEAVVLED